MHQRRRKDDAAPAPAALKKAAAARAAARRQAVDPYGLALHSLEARLMSDNVMYVSMGILLMGMLAEAYAVGHALKIPKVAEDYVPALKEQAVPVPGVPRHVLDYSAQEHTVADFQTLLRQYGARGMRSYTLFLYAELIGAPCLAAYMFITAARLMVACRASLYWRVGLLLPVAWCVAEVYENVVYLDAALAHPGAPVLPEQALAVAAGTVGWFKWKLLAMSMVVCLVAKRNVYAVELDDQKQAQDAVSTAAKQT
eukprot:TRINITY_DN16291_c0_g1_i1.p1 TRINITY_DN16291_c0_g1~~TRINITY_DN16291_c0_g1_i1.p1  ORF type:complete len:255 (+),score=98.22 TRINITY_DN16291_c0_g1_i1:64-828(+)